MIPNMAFGKGGKGTTPAAGGNGPAAVPASEMLPFGLVSNVGTARGTHKLSDKSNAYEVRRCDVYSYNTSHSDPASDLSTASGLNEPAVLNILRARFAQDKIYTRLDPLIISINPYKSIDGLYDFERFSRLSVDDQHAHLFYAASRAFDALHQERDTSNGTYAGSGGGLNQAIAVSGESGAGKTEACKLLISYLIQRAGTGHIRGSYKGAGTNLSHDGASRLDTKLAACSPVLESFGNARTLHNDNSSRFGKYLRLQINVSHSSFLLVASVSHYNDTCLCTYLGRWLHRGCSCGPLSPGKTPHRVATRRGAELPCVLSVISQR
jgi:myosin heavy subunit